MAVEQRTARRSNAASPPPGQVKRNIKEYHTLQALWHRNAVAIAGERSR